MPTRPKLSPRRIRQMWTALASAEREQAAARARQGKTPGKLPGGARVEAGRMRDQIGAIAGVSGRTVEKCIAVYEAAARDPVLFGPVVAYLERSENIHDAHKMMNRVADLDRVRRLAAIAGRFATLALDPPWQDETVSENQRPPYATMTVAEIAAVPVPGWVGDQAHIYCHAPGPWVPTAVALIQGWGFDFKTLLTWQKPRFSQGRYFRTLDEFVVFGTRGGLMLRRQDIPNHFEGPVGAHSEKPDAFYDLVRAASPEPYGEAFQRQARAGFANLYGPAPALEAAE
ncbi:hypothetical protein FV218_15145 [Methylobacterium sp. WL69]|uniref:MT-A70 family methyltransferase n=1 Tax=Methylobacterium sp. WL69 TaxID=2603893 RepID=UPI0011C8A183|nr:MT-A70 family methyltransferase [Methylobacterium sp. WL69]TXM71467.1 hypothetical protein FV218_15145 [Methylobacterium sp. WL69]